MIVAPDSIIICFRASSIATESVDARLARQFIDHCWLADRCSQTEPLLEHANFPPRLRSEKDTTLLALRRPKKLVVLISPRDRQSFTLRLPEVTERRHMLRLVDGIGSILCGESTASFVTGFT